MDGIGGQRKRWWMGCRVVKQSSLGNAYHMRVRHYFDRGKLKESERKWNRTRRKLVEGQRGGWK